jgi:hypothetical protein
MRYQRAGSQTSFGSAMWWFDKGKRKEIWDDEVQWPIGDIEAAHRIRDICRSAADSAERAGCVVEDDNNDNESNGNDRNGNDDNKKTNDNKNKDDGRNRYETDRYGRAARAAMEIAIKISDELLRDSSVRQIVDLCVKANDLRTARILFRAIQTTSIREDVLNDHPIFRQ